MWEPRPLTPLWAFTACSRDSFTFYFLLFIDSQENSHGSWGLKANSLKWSILHRELIHIKLSRNTRVSSRSKHQVHHSIALHCFISALDVFGAYRYQRHTISYDREFLDQLSDN
jgi:hypothetical protein